MAYTVEEFMRLEIPEKDGPTQQEIEAAEDKYWNDLAEIGGLLPWSRTSSPPTASNKK